MVGIQLPADVYADLAIHYDATRGFPEGVGSQIASRICEVIPQATSESVLDLGCGTGRIALPLSSKAFHVVGIDRSSAMLEVCRSKLERERLFLVQGDACDLPFPDNTFGVVTAVSVLHVVDSASSAIAEIHRVLRPGGYLIYGRTRYVGAVGDLFEFIRHDLFRAASFAETVTANPSLEEIDHAIGRTFGAASTFIAASWKFSFSARQVLDQFRSAAWLETRCLSADALISVCSRMESAAIALGISMDQLHIAQAFFECLNFTKPPDRESDDRIFG